MTALFTAYAQSLGVDLGFQGFEAELAGLPGAYAEPDGALLLARLAGGKAVGCVALRALEPGVCEMKRLFVAPAGRGRGIGRVLVAAVLAAAEARGYHQMRLDSLAWLTHALELYREAGFTPIARYCDNPFPDAVFLGRALSPAPHARERTPPPA